MTEEEIRETEIKPYVLAYRVGDCRITLQIPDAIEEMTIINVRKFFKWAVNDYTGNHENLRAFLDAIPAVSAWLKGRWARECIYSQDHCLSEEFDQRGDKITDPKEIRARKTSNKRLEKAVKEAKARYDRFQKRVPRLEELRGLYLDE